MSESKFRADPASFVGPIQHRDTKTLESLITRPEVEAALLVRLESKAKVYGQDLNSTVAPQGSSAGKIDPAVAVQLYREFVIPLTKVVEVDYLLKRCAGAVKIAKLSDGSSGRIRLTHPFCCPIPIPNPYPLPSTAWTGLAKKTSAC